MNEVDPKTLAIFYHSTMPSLLKAVERMAAAQEDEAMSMRTILSTVREIRGIVNRQNADIGDGEPPAG